MTKRSVPSTKRIVIRLLLTALLVGGLVLCYVRCDEGTFLIVLVVVLIVYTIVSLVEAHYSAGNRARWGRQYPGDDG